METVSNPDPQEPGESFELLARIGDSLEKHGAFESNDPFFTEPPVEERNQ